MSGVTNTSTLGYIRTYRDNVVSGSGGGSGATGATGPTGPTGPSGAGNATYAKWTRSTDNETAGFFADAYVIIGWAPSSNEIMIRQPTARPGVYAMGLVTYGGSYPSNQAMILSITSNDFYYQPSLGQIDFTITSDTDHSHPFYKVRVVFTGGGNTNIYAIVEKFT